MQILIHNTKVKKLASRKLEKAILLTVYFGPFGIEAGLENHKLGAWQYFTACSGTRTTSTMKE